MNRISEYFGSGQRSSAMTFSIKPKAGTLGTDDAFLHAAWLEYTPKLLPS